MCLSHYCTGGIILVVVIFAIICEGFSPAAVGRSTVAWCCAPTRENSLSFTLSASVTFALAASPSSLDATTEDA